MSSTRTCVLVAAAAVSLSAPLGACSVVLAGDLDAAREVASTADGAATSGSGGMPADSGVGESGTDSSLVEAAAPKGCAAYQPAPRFCDDFSAPNLTGGWDLDDEGGTSTVTDEEPFSSPRALKVTLDTPSGCKYSRISRGFKTTGNSFTVSTRMRLVGPWKNGLTPIVVSLGSGPASYCAALFYVFSDAQGRIDESSINVQSDVNDNNQKILEGRPSEGEWTDMTVAATRPDGAGTRFTVSFTDADGRTVTTERDFPECKPWTNAQIYIGFHCGNGKGTAYYDDIRVDWE